MTDQLVTSRERVHRAIHFEGPDRVPHYLPDDRENDLLWAACWTVGRGLCPPDRQPWQVCGDVEQRTDAWGVTWERCVGTTVKGEAKQYPIKDITRQAEYLFPQCNDLKYFQHWADAISTNNRDPNPKYVLGVAPFSSLNERTHNIRGLQAMCLDYYDHPTDLKALIGRLAHQQRESIRILADLGCDGVMVYDDWGLQNRLLVGIDLIEAFFLPHYRANWALAHDLGLDVWMHSCGHILEVLPLFIEAGLDVVQMDQQENMGLENLAERVGGQLAFWCPVDIQNTMIYGSVEEVEAYVKRMIRTLGGFNGGLISMAYTSPEDIDHSPEKIAAMCQAFRRYGVYHANIRP